MFANRVYRYLKDVEIKSPYNGWTGATYLRCANSDDGNIRILYDSQPTGQLDTMSVFNPFEVPNEVGSGSPTVGLNETNYDAIDYRIYNGLEYNGAFISVDSNNVLSVDNGQGNIIKMPLLAAAPTYNLWSNLSIGVLAEGEDRETRKSVYSRYKNSLVFQNYTTRIDTMINNSVISDRGKRMMPRYVTALNKSPLQKTDDICVTAEDVLRGEAGVQKVQSMMFSFFMNIMPMASAYPNWRSSGTVEMITNYLTQKLIDDLNAKKLLGPFYIDLYIRLVSA